MRKVESIALLQLGLDDRPDRLLRRIRHEHLNDGAALGGFLDVEERLAGLPAIAYGAIPVSLELGGLADDHAEPVVAHIERLGGTLHAVAEYGDRLVFQDLASPGHGELVAGHHLFLNAAEIDRCHRMTISSKTQGGAA